jgi:sulfur-carrier protein adenylyltransferase/sulfurtransferase
VKLILGRGEPLIGRLLLYNAMAMTFREMRLARDPACPVCGPKATIRSLQDLAASCPGPAAGGADITPAELKRALDRGAPLVLLDVREPQEYERGCLPGARLVPLGELARRLGEIGRDRPVVVYCRSGGRSARAAKILREAGFADVKNLAGGILAWADQVDPSMPKY